MNEHISHPSRLNAIAAKRERIQLLIPYLISIIFVAVSINSIARGINNHETWRIITAGIGGSFFLFLAIITAVKLIKALVRHGRKTDILSHK